MGTIGPKPNPRPLILHVDSDTNVPYRLAESTSLVVDSITANTYNGLPSLGSITNVTSLEGTGIFALTSTNVTAFNGTGVFTTTSTNVTSFAGTGAFATPGYVINELSEYCGPGLQSPATGDLPYYDDSTWKLLTGAVAGDVITFEGGVPVWRAPEGSVTIPIPISQGGSNFTGPYQNNSVIYYNNSTGKFASDTDLTFDATTNTLTAGSAVLNNPLAVAYGGTAATTTAQARTNLGLGNLAVINSPLPVANGGTNSTTQVTNGVSYFDNATTSLKTTTDLTFNGTTLDAPNLTLDNPLPVAEGGTGRDTLTAGNFLIGNGTVAISFSPTASFETTAHAAATYFNKSTDTLAVARGGTNSTGQTNYGVLWYDGGGAQITSNTNLKLGTTSKLLAVCGVAVPSKGLYIENGNLNPTTEFKLQDIYDVTTTLPSNGQVLTYDTGISRWKPATPTAGSETWTTVLKTEFTSNNDITLVADAELFFNVTSTNTYRYTYDIFFSAGSTSKFDYYIGDPGVTEHYWNIEYTSPNTVLDNRRSRVGSGSMAEIQATVDNSGEGNLKISGIITPSTTGTVYFYFARNANTGSQDVYIRPGSTLQYVKINP